MDDLFIIASSRAQAESLLKVAEEELDKIHMQFNYDKCNALWVKEGAIVMEGAIETERGAI
jgi:transcriptional regulator of acetoin/glycerol metabolism